MTPMTHALVTVAQLLDELGQPERYASAMAYEHGDARVQVWLDGKNDVDILDALAARFGAAVERGTPRTDSDGASRQVSVATVRDGVTVTFWTYEQVTA